LLEFIDACQTLERVLNLLLVLIVLLIFTSISPDIFNADLGHWLGLTFLQDQVSSILCDRN